jgi:hypothetical protein
MLKLCDDSELALPVTSVLERRLPLQGCSVRVELISPLQLYPENLAASSVLSLSLSLFCWD